MAKTKISEFSSTPANNTDIDSINIAEGCAPSGINDAIRELMAQLKDFQTGAAGDSFNGPIGTSTPAAGAFTTLSASSTTTLSGLTASTALALDASKNVVSVTNTGTGNNVLATSPTLVTPILGTPTSATLTNATGLPIATGVSGLGTGVATALAVNVGSAGAPVVNGGALGTPSSGTATNLTGLPLSTGVTGTLPTTNGGTGLTSFTANGVLYASSTSALTSGSALSFNGTNSLTVTANSAELYLAGGNSAAQGGFLSISRGGTAKILLGTASNVLGGGSNTSDDLTLFATAESRFYASSAEGMRLTSTGLGIGTSSPFAKLSITTTNGNFGIANGNTSGGTKIQAFGTTTSSDGYLAFEGYTKEYGRFDSAGNLGLGLTPSSTIWSGDETRLVVKGNGASKAGVLALQSQGTTNSTTAFFVAEDLRAGATLGTTTNSFLAFNTNNTERARIDSSGNLLVGTTSAGQSGAAKFTVTGNAVVFNPNTDGKNTHTFTTDAVDDGTYSIKSNTVIKVKLHSNGDSYFTGGNLLVGKTSSNLANAGIEIFGAGYGQFTASGDASLFTNRLASDGDTVKFYRATSLVGSISVTSTATAYNTSSDYRLKNSVTPMTGALAKVVQLKPCTYKWNADGSDGEGFIAHELAEVCPQAVTGEKDAVDEEGNPKYQGIDTSFLVATLTAAIQELKAEFDAYKASHP